MLDLSSLPESGAMVMLVRKEAARFAACGEGIGGEDVPADAGHEGLVDCDHRRRDSFKAPVTPCPECSNG